MNQEKTERLIDAAELQDRHGIKKGSSYRLARAGIIPAYRTGPKLRGLRFLASEVLSALRQPAKRSSEDGQLR